jgi:hypothetical protein
LQNLYQQIFRFGRPAEKEGRDGNLIFSRRWDAMAGNRESGNVVLFGG